MASRAGEEADADFRLAGPLCDGGDVFAGDADSPYRRFPAATTVGDVVAFLDAGAYTLEMMNPYNARPTAAAFAVTAAGRLVQIRRRDTAEDLVAHDLVPGERLSVTRPTAGGPWRSGTWSRCSRASSTRGSGRWCARR